MHVCGNESNHSHQPKIKISLLFTLQCRKPTISIIGVKSYTQAQITGIPGQEILFSESNVRGGEFAMTHQEIIYCCVYD